MGTKFLEHELDVDCNELRVMLPETELKRTQNQIVVYTWRQYLSMNEFEPPHARKIRARIGQCTSARTRSVNKENYFLWPRARF